MADPQHATPDPGDSAPNDSNRRLAALLVAVLAVVTLALIAVGPAEAESCGEPGAIHDPAAAFLSPRVDQA